MSALRPDRSVIATYAVAAVTFVVVFLAFPGHRDGLLVEDGPLETLTAGVFVIAAGVGVLAIRRSGGTARRVAWTVTVFATLAFLDEISFGFRLFDITPPRIMDIDVDSLHDVFDLAERAAERAGIGRTGLAALTLALAGVLVAVVVRSGRLPQLVAWVGDHPAVAWIGISVGLLVTAVGLDLLGTTDPMRLGEELLELAGASAAVQAARRLRSRTPLSLVPADPLVPAP
ncbi:MAG: hypothetical protein R3290_06920 [Acidimicrobiia bacterium]|nr:hypothetical protein [Acidimicrobiia bacterium]